MTGFTKIKCAGVWAVLPLLISAAAMGADQTGRSIQLPDDNPMATLKPGPGSDVTQRNCAICHSTDYIVRQPGSDTAHWEAEVKKMVTVFGAPISEEDVKAIVGYLSTAYGPGTSVAVPPRRRLPPRPRPIRKPNPK